MYICLTLSDTDNSNVHREENSRLQTTKAFRLQRSLHIHRYESRCASETDHSVPASVSTIKLCHVIWRRQKSSLSSYGANVIWCRP